MDYFRKQRYDCIAEFLRVMTRMTETPLVISGGSSFLFDNVKWTLEGKADFIVEITNMNEEDSSPEITLEPVPNVVSGPEPKFVTSSPEFFCPDCNKAFTTHFSLQRHNAVQHGILDKNKAHFKCLECTRIFFCNDELNRHMIKKHNCPNAVLHRCGLCGRLFPSQYELARHRVKIHEPKTIPCKYCDKKFARDFLLKDHLKRNHRKALTVKCKTCHEMIPMSDMDHHMNTEHPKAWTCSVCEKVFLKQALLAKHETEEHGKVS